MIIRKGKIPKLRNPTAIAGFVGFGNVGKITVEYLIDALDAKKVLEVYTDLFPHLILVGEDGIADIPKIEFFVFRKKRKDFIIVTSDIQPSTERKNYRFSYLIFKELKKAGIKEIITAGGLARDFEPEEPRVYGVATDEKAKKKFKKFGVIFDSNVVRNVIGGAGLLIGFAKIFGIRGVSLLGETLYAPYYLGLKAARSIVKVISKAYNLKISLEDLEEEIRQYEERLKAQTEEMEKFKRILEKEERKKLMRYFR